MNDKKAESLILPHGGYRALISFQIAQLIFDITFRFCNRFIPKGSRTHDQMVQAARSGVQNIAEGSQASGTSKKTELKLTNVARASLEELRLDYQDYLRQRNFPSWEYDEPLSKELIRNKFSTADEFAAWVGQKSKAKNQDPSIIAANGTLILLNVACHLLNKQISSLAESFEREGGFTERLYRFRKNARY